MPEIFITIPANFTQEHEHVVLKYFETAGRLALRDWKIAFEAFDKLAHAKINWQARQMYFGDYYKQFVEAIHADGFILALLKAENISTVAEQLQAEVSQFLAAYNLYWWNSFARGYGFEIEVFRKLDAAGIAYTAHDLLDKTERLSPYDLTILGYLGDIKNTTYFLHSRRNLPLLCDFYITRLWHARHRRYILAVILMSQMWEQINGATHTALLEEAAYFFPNPVAVTIEERTWIVIPFSLFFKKIGKKQREED